MFHLNVMRDRRQYQKQLKIIFDSDSAYPELESNSLIFYLNYMKYLQSN